MHRSVGHMIKTPLEALTEMNELVGKIRKRRAKPATISSAVEGFYRRQLVAMLRSAVSSVEENIIPVLKQEESRFIRDESTDRYLYVAGLHVFIENWAGEKRKEEWPALRHHYGYIRGTSGADGDDVDVFLKSRIIDEKLPVFIVDQVTRSGEFDEHKVMLGFSSKEDARSSYLSNFTDGWIVGRLVEMKLDEFKEWLRNANLSRPASVTDSAFNDGWTERLISAIAKVLSDFDEGVFAQQAERLARTTVNMVEAKSTEAFLKSVNGAVGVDLRNVLSNEGMSDYIDLAVKENAALIKSIPKKHLEEVERIILDGTRSGESVRTIANRLSEQFDVNKRRASFIARDQVAKINTDVTERRQTESGIVYYRSSHSNDIRVTGNPRGKYPNAKISCWDIAKQDVGFGPGVYKWSEGASYGGQKGLHPGRHHIGCRCTPSPVFEWELPNRGNRK